VARIEARRLRRRRPRSWSGWVGVGRARAVLDLAGDVASVTPVLARPEFTEELNYQGEV